MALALHVNYGLAYGADNVVLSDPKVVPEPASLILFNIDSNVDSLDSAGDSGAGRTQDSPSLTVDGMRCACLFPRAE